MDNTMRDRAIELARQGFSVFPLKEGIKDTPIVPPGVRLKKGTYFDVVPSSDPDKVRALWTRADGESHNYNIGGCCNELFVPDLDMKDGKNGVAAFQQIAQEPKRSRRARHPVASICSTSSARIWTPGCATR